MPTKKPSGEPLEMKDDSDEGLEKEGKGKGDKASAEEPEDSRKALMGDTEEEKVAYWLDQLKTCLRRERHFRKSAAEAVALYECEDSAEEQYNILYANVETTLPGLYSNTPRPVVSRRFKDADPVGKHVSAILTRLLSYFIDPSTNEQDSFDEVMQNAVLQALVAGRGCAWFEGEVEEDGSSACILSKPMNWDEWYMGFAKTWAEVPWIARPFLMTREELIENFGEEKGREVSLNMILTEEGQRSSGGGSDDPSADGDLNEEDKGVGLAQVFQIWDKATRSIKFVSTGYIDGFLKEVPDPYGLKDFYPCPRPLLAFSRIGSMLPQTPYQAYVSQAKELNRITRRIQRIIEALRVRGGYDATVEGLADMLNADDNQLLPINNFAAFRAQGSGGGALENALFIVPIEKLVTVLQQLYQQREGIKQVIYEITGLADIARGSSKASETLGAQELKSQWGSLRLKRLRKRVETYARDCLRIQAEIAAKTFPEEVIKKICGLYYPTEREKQMIQAQMQQKQQQFALAQAQQKAQAAPQQVPGAPGMPGRPPTPPPQPAAPPSPPQLSPEEESKMRLPTWEQLFSMIKDDVTRTYAVDVETNSTVILDASEEQQNIGQFMNAMAQFLSGIMPAIESGYMPFEAAKAMLLTICRRFEFGSEVEAYIEQMAAPKPKQDPKLAIDAQNAKAKMAELQMKGQLEQAKTQADIQAARETHALEMQSMQAEMQMRQQEMQLEMRKLQAETQAAFAKLRIDVEKARASAQAAEHKARIATKAAQDKAAQAAAKPSPKTP